MSEIPPDQLKKAQQRVFHYKTNPYDFVTEVLRVPEISVYHHISDQQKDLLQWCGAKVAANYRQWNVNKLQKDLEFPPAMQEIAGQIGVSVMSGKGTGKDASTAWLLIWLISCFKNCKVYIVAPNERSIKQILFPEIVKWLDQKLPTGEFAFKFRDQVKVEGERIYWTDCPNPKFDRTIEPIIAGAQLNDEQKQAVLSGRHEKNMVFVFEEATGISDAVFQPLENTLSSENNFCLMLFNPNRTGGYAVNSHSEKMAPFWKQLHWDSEKSSVASQDNIKRLEALHGRDSNNFRINVLGLPPLAGSDTLIPHEWVMQAAMAEISPDPDSAIIMGIDPARYGGDTSVIVVRQGRVVLDIRRFQGLDGKELAERMIEADMDYDVQRAYIDAIGVGASPYDFAKNHFRGRLSPVIVSRKPEDQNRFMRLRDELWWRCREWFSEEGMIDIPFDDEFIEQLSDIRYEDSGKVKVEGKKELKKRKGGDASPDVADALCLTFRYGADAGRKRQAIAYRRNISGRQRHWMTA